jgi:hypothetical protein
LLFASPPWNRTITRYRAFKMSNFSYFLLTPITCQRAETSRVRIAGSRSEAQ